MLANQRVDRAAFRRHGGVARLHTRHNRINRIGSQPRQYKPASGSELHQGVVASIGGTATSGNKPGTEQLTTAGQIHRSARLYRHRLSTQHHPDIQATTVIRCALANECDFLAVVHIDLAIHRTAVRQHQALATH